MNQLLQYYTHNCTQYYCASATCLHMQMRGQSFRNHSYETPLVSFTLPVSMQIPMAWMHSGFSPLYTMHMNCRQ